MRLRNGTVCVWRVGVSAQAVYPSQRVTRLPNRCCRAHQCIRVETATLNAMDDQYLILMHRVSGQTTICHYCADYHENSEQFLTQYCQRRVCHRHSPPMLSQTRVSEIR